MRYTKPDSLKYANERRKQWERNKARKERGEACPYSMNKINERLEFWTAQCVLKRLEGE